MKASASAWPLLLAAALCVPATAQDMPAPRNTRHALVIGIGEYSSPGVPKLEGVSHDMVSARRMALAMAVPEANITVLRDGEATAERIRKEIDALGGRVKDGDRVFVYFSGHGTRWLDATPGEGSGSCTEGLLASDGQVLSNIEVGNRLAPLSRRVDKMLVFYDACFSGGVAGAPFRTRTLNLGGDIIKPKFTAVGAAAACAQPSNFRTRSLALVMQQRQALPETVVYVAASRPDEVSFDSALQGGFATRSWRDCLLGEARDLDQSGAITIDEVTRCAQAKVTTALAGYPGILGQNLTVHGNAAFVPAWMGAAFATAPAPASTAAPMPAPSVAVQTVIPAPPAQPSRPAEILAELHGQRDGHNTVTVTLRKPQLKIDVDTLQMEVTSARDGFLYVVQAGSDGASLYLLYPNDLATDNKITAGQRLRLPGKTWEVVPGGPPGTETLLVMVTDAPRDLGALRQVKAGPFMKTLLDEQGRARLQWVLSNGTPSVNCDRPGKSTCSDAFGAALLKVQTVN